HIHCSIAVSEAAVLLSLVAGQRVVGHRTLVGTDRPTAPTAQRHPPSALSSCPSSGRRRPRDGTPHLPPPAFPAPGCARGFRRPGPAAPADHHAHVQHRLRPPRRAPGAAAAVRAVPVQPAHGGRGAAPHRADDGPPQRDLPARRAGVPCRPRVRLRRLRARGPPRAVGGPGGGAAAPAAGDVRPRLHHPPAMLCDVRPAPTGVRPRILRPHAGRVHGAAPRRARFLPERGKRAVRRRGRIVGPPGVLPRAGRRVRVQRRHRGRGDRCSHTGGAHAPAGADGRSPGGRGGVDIPGRRGLPRAHAPPARHRRPGTPALRKTPRHGRHGPLPPLSAPPPARHGRSGPAPPPVRPAGHGRPGRTAACSSGIDGGRGADIDGRRGADIDAAGGTAHRGRGNPGHGRDGEDPVDQGRGGDGACVAGMYFRTNHKGG
ncbi:hypothetical protein DFJ74DRAFT_748060, partial [Hyaloraphidium curvatum]